MGFIPVRWGQVKFLGSPDVPWVLQGTDWH